MSGRLYETHFTDAFWKAADDLGLPRHELTAKSLTLMENPFQGKEVGERGGSIRVLDIKFSEQGSFRWFYIVEEDLHLVMNVFLLPSEDPVENQYAEIKLMTHIAGIVLRIIAGG